MAKILLVDDDPFVLEVHEFMLRDFGYDVITQQVANSALTLIREGVEIDLVITDYSMPIMNGIEFIKALRQTLPDTPVIMLTGYSDEEINPDLDIFKCVGKPVKTKEFGKIIETALGHMEASNLLRNIV